VSANNLAKKGASGYFNILHRKQYDNLGLIVFDPHTLIITNSLGPGVTRSILVNRKALMLRSDRKRARAD